MSYIPHVIPVGKRSDGCTCAPARCGALALDHGCPEHGTEQSPGMMEWHPAGGERCQELARLRYRCSRGQEVPTDTDECRRSQR